MINKKHFSFFENCKPMRVWLWFVCKFTESYCHLPLFSEFIQNSEKVSYFFWQNTYPNLKTTCHIKLKYFLWTKPLENLSLAKYLMPFTATLIINIWKGKREREKKRDFNWMENFKVESRHLKSFYKFMAFIRCMKAVFYKPNNQKNLMCSLIK